MRVHGHTARIGCDGSMDRRLAVDSRRFDARTQTKEMP